MHRRSSEWLLVGLIGLLTGLAATATLGLGGSALLRLQVAASDWMFLHTGGPRLGTLAAPKNLLLVQYDQRSARAMKSTPTFEQDAQLYRTLLDAGATLVADTRMIADTSAPESSTVKPLLDAMLATAAEGKLFRDVWLTSDWPAAELKKYQPMIAHNLLNMHPNSDSFFDSRLYPLVAATADGVHESMPLVLARRARGIEQVDSEQVVAEIKRSGIAALWQTSMPQGMSLPAATRSDIHEPTPYHLGTLPIPWYPIDCKSPLVPPAGYWINYASPPESLPRMSYVDALEGASPDDVAGKIVLIGYEATVDPTSDTYAVPTSTRRAAAVEVVAAALETLLAPALVRLAPVGAVVASAWLLAWLAAAGGGLLRPARAATSIAALLAAYLLIAFVAFRNGWLVDLVLAPAAGLVAGAVAAGFRYWREVRSKSRIIDLFGRYVPQAVVTQLIQQRDADALALGGVNREVTVLFADVRGFTTYAERHPPEEVLERLNTLLKIMVDCTFTNEGTLDKFIGDAILVLFNAPLDQPDHAARAARTAWAIQQGLVDHPSGLSVGIGIHTGQAIVGRVGTPRRMEYTAIGSTVNLASRLCSAAPSRKIVVSAAVAALLGDEFVLEPQPPIRVKGVEEELATSVVVGLKKG